MKLEVIKTNRGYVAISNEKVTGCIGYNPETKSIEFFASHPKYDESGLKIIATDSSFKLEGIPQFELSPKRILTDEEIDSIWLNHEEVDCSHNTYLIVAKAIQNYLNKELIAIEVEESDYTYEEFKNLPESDITNKIEDEEFKYSEGNETSEQWFYGNIKWIRSLLGQKPVIIDGLLTVKQYIYK